MNYKDRQAMEFAKFIGGCADQNIAKGRYVISDIYDWGCDVSTVVRYRVGEKKFRARVTSCRRMECC